MYAGLASSTALEDQVSGTEIPMTEAEARAALRAFEAVGAIEQWIAEQLWKRLAGARTASSWRFLLEPVPGGVRVIMTGAGDRPADWIVPYTR
jgi:hypothetical protein